MGIKLYPKSKQANGNFNFGEILEKKPIGFPQDNGQLRPYSNLFYWAHAWTSMKRSTIGLHPHQGFEICTFVLKGSINHYDTQLNKWIKLNEGDVQIIRSGNGISHSEEILENSEIFQIWFDPDLSKSLKKPASYNDYKKNEFNFTEFDNFSIKHIHNKNSKMWMDSEGIVINEYFFEKSSSGNIKIKKDKIHSFFLIDGEVSFKGFDFKKGDFFTVSKLENIEIATQKSSKLFEISSPIKPSYRTYSN
ncbi:MAG: pirin family protein [Flavobacteriaceae bacterium]|nr:pirin family protein [Flavobacteriaceae bacterium]